MEIENKINHDQMLNKLVQQLIEAKKEESAAKKKRTFIEEEIANLVETKENESKTVEAGEGFKVTVKRAMSYKADLKGIRSLEIPEEVMPIKMTDPVPAGYEFDTKEYERIIEDHPDVAAKLAKFVTATPRKVSVTPKIG